MGFVLAAWLAAVGLSLAWTALDVVRHANRAMPVMNFVWPLMPLYFGPLGLLLYVGLSGRAAAGHPVSKPVMPAPAAGAVGRSGAMYEMATMADTMGVPARAGMMHGTAERHDMAGMRHGAMDPLWQRALRSSTHCAAGCALGDLVAMGLVEGAGLFGGTMLAEVASGTVLAFLLGLFVFQAFPVMAERRVSFGEALSVALRADALTIGAYLVGQITALYAIARIVPMGSNLAVSFVAMQAAMAVGFLTTYPANYGLVAAGIKEGM